MTGGHPHGLHMDRGRMRARAAGGLPDRYRTRSLQQFAVGQLTHHAPPS